MKQLQKNAFFIHLHLGIDFLPKVKLIIKRIISSMLPISLSFQLNSFYPRK